MPTSTAHISRIGIAKPDYEVTAAFVDWADGQLSDRRDRALLRRMASRSGIDQRWSVIPPASGGGSQAEAGGFYGGGVFPLTSTRMSVYAEEAPKLALEAIVRLDQLGIVTHLVVASCTGFTAPGIDQVIAERLGLPGSIERTLIGFMGCYAGVAALRVANYIIHADPNARVLVVTIELPTLHLQPDTELEPILAQMLWSDGAAAALVSAEPSGIALGRFFAATIPESQGLIRWTIGDTGFAMHLSGDVPGRIAHAVAHHEPLKAAIGSLDGVDGWAVHAGGRSVLDAVESGLKLDPDALRHSRRVLAENGNMSSVTIMLVLASILAEGPPEHGLAIAFGPGLAAEGFHFGSPQFDAGHEKHRSRFRSRRQRVLRMISSRDATTIPSLRTDM